MEQNNIVNVELFKKKLLALCLRSGLSGLPKDELDQQILLKSIALTIGNSASLNEQEVNEKIKYWINRVSQMDKLDHSSLRRWLVDAGYLTRTSDGARYQVQPGAPRQGFFDPGVNEMDIPSMLQAGRDEIEQRKQAYLARNAGKATRD
jgi:hypothetical protein